VFRTKSINFVLSHFLLKRAKKTVKMMGFLTCDVFEKASHLQL
jgi:hypothetical protein